MNLRRSAFALAFAFCFGLAPSVARAQISDFDRNTARTLGQEGHEALDRSDFSTAADRFTRAVAIVHAPTFLLGLAEAQVGLGKLVSALATYNRIVREGLPPSPPAAFTKALETARAEIEALARRIPYVIVQVAGPGAATARVTIDGLPVPAAALGVKRPVDPGKHLIRAEAPGLAPGEGVVDHRPRQDGDGDARAEACLGRPCFGAPASRRAAAPRLPSSRLGPRRRLSRLHRPPRPRDRRAACWGSQGSPSEARGSRWAP